jgi:hypothetical protein
MASAHDGQLTSDVRTPSGHRLARSASDLAYVARLLKVGNSAFFAARPPCGRVPLGALISG